MKKCIMGFLLLFSFTIQADPYVGGFTAHLQGISYALSLEKNADGSYQGVMNLNGERIPLVGDVINGRLVGRLSEEGEAYQFVLIDHTDGSLLFQDQDGIMMLFKPTHAATISSSKTAGKSVTKEGVDMQGGMGEREVYINRVKLDKDTLAALENLYQTPLQEGRYWYDPVCGAWGIEGGPAAGFIMAGLSLPGPLPADISGSGTGIFINGREIHPLDQQGLQQLFGITYQGRYWLDAQGNLGIEGGPMIVNIIAQLQAAQAQQGGSSSHGYGKAYGARGTLAGDGGGGFMYSGTTAGGKSVFWYPGM